MILLEYFILELIGCCQLLLYFFDTLILPFLLEH